MTSLLVNAASEITFRHLRPSTPALHAQRAGHILGPSGRTACFLVDSTCSSYVHDRLHANIAAASAPVPSSWVLLPNWNHLPTTTVTHTFSSQDSHLPKCTID